MKPDQLKEDKLVIKIRKALNKHGLFCNNEKCKMSLDCTIDYELFDLFQSEWDKRELKTDFPTAWKVMNMTDPEQHHEKCSFRQSKGGILCDCAAEKVFIATVKLAQTPSKVIDSEESLTQRDLGDTDA